MLRRLASFSWRSWEITPCFPCIPATPLTCSLSRFASLFSTQNFVASPDRTKHDGYPMSVSTVGSFPLASDVIRQDVVRFFKSCNITGEDIMVQYAPNFRPQLWWIRFHSEEDRNKALSIPNPRWGGRKVLFAAKNMQEWAEGTFNHLVGRSLGSAVLISRLAFDTVPEDLASFFRNFHLQGNGVTLLQDPYRPNVVEQNQFKRAIVRLISTQEAQRAARALHRKYLRGNMVTLRVLQ